MCGTYFRKLGNNLSRTYAGFFNGADEWLVDLPLVHRSVLLPADEKGLHRFIISGATPEQLGVKAILRLQHCGARSGTHVQKLLGTLDKVHSLRGNVSEKKYNEQTVRLELQADFYAGIWAHHAQKMKNILETGDIEEAMNAAQAVGDDRIQMQSRGYVVPDSFTHGTSEQRMTWFERGFTTGNVNNGDTFREEI
jgi:hypothetical protein